MSSQTTTLDGNIDLLVRAMRDVFVGAMEKTGSDIRADIKTDLHAMENRLNNKIDTVEGCLNGQIDTTNKNMQAQFAQQERSIAELSKNIADIDRKLDNDQHRYLET